MRHIELFINGQRIDLDSSPIFPLTYSQADIKNPEKRKSSASKTIDAPGTQTNNRFFSSAYNLSLSDVEGDGIGFEFDPTLRYPAIVTEGGSVIFQGAASLTKVVRTAGVNKFSLVLYSDIANIIQSLGDRLVSELDWSDYDHTLSVANIEASWAAAPGLGYVYGLVHYGYTSNLLVYKTNQLYPHIYITEFMTKCLEASGFSISSTFLNSNPIERLVWGWGGGTQITIDSAEVSNREADYTGDGTLTESIPVQDSDFITGIASYGILMTMLIADTAIITMTQVTDTLSQYNESTGEIVIAKSGNYNLEISGTFPLTWAFSDLTLLEPHYKIVVYVKIYKNFAMVSETSYTVFTTSAGSTNINVAINQALECDTNDVYFRLFR